MPDVKFTSVPSKRLSESITAASAFLKLNNIKGWDDNNLVAGDFGSILYAVLRNDANTIMELIELDPSTIADGSITINKRGLQFDGNLATEVSGNKKTWVKNETIVELGSNPPQLLNHIVRIIGAQIIADVKTFSSLPRTTAGDPVDDADLARKAYVDAVVAGTFPASRIVVAGNAGETVAAGDMLYFDETDNEWKLADADAASTSENVLLGIAQGAGTNGNVITNGVLLIGLDTNQTGMTIGDVQYLSGTAGEITTTPGTKNVSIGIAKSATELYFSPRFILALTKDQQDALAGDSGTPSADNLYITELGLQRSTEIYAADAEASDTYVVTLDPVPAGYVAGMTIRIKANTVNTGAATIDVNSLGAKAITKNGAVVLEDGDIRAGQVVTLIYDGTQFQLQNVSDKIGAVKANVQSFTTAGADSWTKPSAAKRVFVQLWGAGGSGGGIDDGGGKAGGGGGGGYADAWFDAADLSASETLAIGAGGVAITTSTDSVGNVGGNTSFGSAPIFIAYGGGGGGTGGSGNTNTGGGGGGGALSAGGVGASEVSGIAGNPTALVGAGGNSGFLSGGGDGYGTGNGTSNARYGGAGGGSAGGLGGTSELGGDGSDGVTSGSASAGSQPGGGGGGASGASSTASGAGGDGKIIITTFF